MLLVIEKCKCLDCNSYGRLFLYDDGIVGNRNNSGVRTNISC